MGVPYAEVIGDPIAHSKSPAIHKFWLEATSMEGDYRATQVRKADLVPYLAERRADPDWRGCNLTMPLKAEVAPLLDGSFPAAAAAGAVNTVFRHGEKLIGNNTDLRGFAEPFRDVHQARGSALILGAGGAARAVFIALAGLGFEPVRVMARKPLVRSGGHPSFMRHAWLPMERLLPAADLVVNATPIGMAGGPQLDFDLSQLPSGACAYDLVYNPLETPFLAAARRRGLRTIDGLAMLIGQAAWAFTHFFEADPPRELDGALRELLTQ
ncbi:MAG TPA: shikimate dehydrogenase, partial [Allosphingosinicella sp.]|jgi:shikimate dehydrogenase